RRPGPMPGRLLLHLLPLDGNPHLAAKLAAGTGGRTKAAVDRDVPADPTGGGNTHSLDTVVEAATDGHGEGIGIRGHDSGHGIGYGNTGHGAVIDILGLILQPAVLVHVHRVGAVDTRRHIGDPPLTADGTHR